MKKGSWFLIFLWLLLTQSCTEKKPYNEAITKFKKPFILYAAQPASSKKIFIKPEYVMPSQPVFAGKYKFSDTIKLVPDKLSPYFQKDLLIEPGPYLPDSLDHNGFELITDYDKNIYYSKFKNDSTLICHYPVYLVNATNTPKIFLGKDSHGFGIQEAVDTTRDRWVPIECKLGDFCGNGEWGLVVKPKEFIVLLLRKNNGNIKTNMRVRIANGATIYVSKPFKGNITQTQFRLHNFIKKSFKDPNGMEPSNIFYGAPFPKEWLY